MSQEEEVVKRPDGAKEGSVEGECSEQQPESAPAAQPDSAACYEAQQLLSRQLIEQSLEEMVTELNSKRSRDQTLLENFRKDLAEWCGSACAAVEAAAYEKSKKNSHIINGKLEKLGNVLVRIRKLESEMEQFRQQLGAFCTDVR